MIRVCLPFIFLFFYCSPVFTQKVLFEPSLFDFGIFHENAGPVVTEFKLSNNGLEQYKVKGLISSCGCTNVEVSKDSLLSGSSLKLKVQYNPVGRPGYFFKQVSVVLQKPNADTLVVEAFIKGNVLSKDQVNYNPLNLTNAVVQLKPLVLEYSLINENALADFINDLTIVLDKDGFANVTINCSAESRDAAHSQIIQNIKKKITAGIVQRGYKDFLVGYTLIESAGINTFFTLGVAGYANNSLASSTVLLKGYRFIGVDRQSADSVITFYQTCLKEHPLKLNFERKETKALVEAMIRQILMHGTVWLATMVHGVHPDNMELFSKNTFKSYVNQLKKELESEGVNVQQVVFVNPVFGNQPEKSVCFEVVIPQKDQAVSWLKFQKNLDSIWQMSTAVNSEPIYKNNLPVYYQRIVNENPLDTSDVQFKEWFNLVQSKLKTNPGLKIMIEATASNSPTTKKYDNDFVARRRLKSSQELLVSWFKKHGIAQPEKLMSNSYALVKGPLYHEQDFLVQHYNKYQYIKILAVEIDSGVNIQGIKTIPYQIGFNNNGIELPKESPVFEQFINSLIPLINKYGFVELIVESSSSKVPTSEFRSNRVLAFERLQKSKDAIQKAVAERGYNPLRVVFTEERILVQGPKFTPGMDGSSQYYKDFQYVKVIPAVLISR